MDIIATITSVKKVLMIIYFFQERAPFIPPNARIPTRLGYMEEPKDDGKPKRKLEKDYEEELAEDYVLDLNSKSWCSSILTI